MKKGDLVRCLSDFGSEGVLKIGEVYPVASRRDDDIWIKGTGRWWSIQRFEMEKKSAMNNIVTEIDILKDKIDIETSLRHAADVEMRNNGGETTGPMVEAHDRALEELVSTARALLAKADGTG